MPCRKSTYKKIMDNVRKQYPNYSLKRRKKIVGAIIYRKKPRLHRHTRHIFGSHRI